MFNIRTMRWVGMRALVGLVLAIACPALALADVLNLACTQVGTTGMISGPCSDNCQTFVIGIDMSSAVATIPANMAETYSGSSQATITESTITWATEHYDFELSRYTGILHERANPKHGQMIDISDVWKCSPVQKQF